MKGKIYNKFQLYEPNRTNLNLHTGIIKGTNSKPKIKIIRTTLKTNIYNYFQLKGTIAQIKSSIKEIRTLILN